MEKKRAVYLYQVADNEECMKAWGCQELVAQTAFSAVIAMDLLEHGVWKVKACSDRKLSRRIRSWKKWTLTRLPLRDEGNVSAIEMGGLQTSCPFSWVGNASEAE